VPPFPVFSTAALNTTVNILGRSGNLMRMITAFEILSAPLPDTSEPNSNSNLTSDQASTYVDDEAPLYGYSTSSDVSSPLTDKVLLAQPNTTTYTSLVHFTSINDAELFARHYLLSAVHDSRQASAALREQLEARERGPSEDDDGEFFDPFIPSPSVAVSAKMILPLHGYANRAGKSGLMQWLLSLERRLVVEKEAELDFMLRIASSASASRISESSVEVGDGASEVEGAASIIEDPRPRPRAFDIIAHITVLRKDIEKINGLAERTAHALTRVQRQQELKLVRRFERGQEAREPRRMWTTGPSGDQTPLNLPQEEVEARRFSKGRKVKGRMPVGTVRQPKVKLPSVHQWWRQARFSTPGRVRVRGEGQDRARVEAVQ